MPNQDKKNVLEFISRQVDAFLKSSSNALDVADKGLRKEEHFDLESAQNYIAALGISHEDINALKPPEFDKAIELATNFLKTCPQNVQKTAFYLWKSLLQVVYEHDPDKALNAANSVTGHSLQYIIDPFAKRLASSHAAKKFRPALEKATIYGNAESKENFEIVVSKLLSADINLAVDEMCDHLYGVANLGQQSNPDLKHERIMEDLLTSDDDSFLELDLLLTSKTGKKHFFPAAEELARNKDAQDIKSKEVSEQDTKKGNLLEFPTKEPPQKKEPLESKIDQDAKIQSSTLECCDVLLAHISKIESPKVAAERAQFMHDELRQTMDSERMAIVEFGDIDIEDLTPLSEHPFLQRLSKVVNKYSKPAATRPTRKPTKKVPRRKPTPEGDG